MTAEDQRQLRLSLHRLRCGHIADARRRLGQPGWPWRASGGIRFDQPHKLGDARRCEAHSQAADVTRRHIHSQMRMHEVILHQRNHVLDDRTLDADPFEKVPRRNASRRLMTIGGPPQRAILLAQCGRPGFGEVVRKRGKQQHRPLVAFEAVAVSDRRRRVDDVHCVRCHIALRMPLRILWHADDLFEVFDFRKV